ncbi:MAG: hypothetical protein WCX46_00855 [Candidatus Paceibacterota bacterium]|jgi:hypothetical protein
MEKENQTNHLMEENEQEKKEIKRMKYAGILGLGLLCIIITPSLSSFIEDWACAIIFIGGLSFMAYSYFSYFKDNK